ncbi:MAG TPA: hypothetical protein VHP58_00260 [Alphaproteobacteria bacterium]|nr:hypothetical protein [Alphaproteobacteria bacterium]
MKMRGALCALLLAGCSTGPQYAPAPKAVNVVSSCPPTMVQQARWLQSNLARVSLGSRKLDVTAIIGNPARAESFMLTDGSSVEVLFYHTASTVCRRPDIDASLLPFVFQNDRLLGYGQNYYHDFIIPQLRNPLPLASSKPQNPVTNAPPRTMTEDLPGSTPRYGTLSRGKTVPPRSAPVPTSPEYGADTLQPEAPDDEVNNPLINPSEQLGRGAPIKPR